MQISRVINLKATIILSQTSVFTILFLNLFKNLWRNTIENNILNGFVYVRSVSFKTSFEILLESFC